jgi:N-acetylglucosaminyl-diphospho-decaprenol L-rhamnosyltransferase
VDCDWTSGSFMIARREALEGSGFLDERFFIYSEETDLCRRIKDAGWAVRHLPTMTILHHAGKAGVSERMAAQEAYARVQYARKHFSPVHRAVYGAALMLGYGLRAGVPGRGTSAADLRRTASLAALRVLLGRSDPPFGEPPRQAVASARKG